MSRHRGEVNRVRIIGGSLRGRKLTFPTAPGLRPTPDRVRETLFNWLQPHIQGARCLDLFAGSGALGFEAASRGAGHVVLVEGAAPAVHCLRRNVELLALSDVEVVQADVTGWLSGRVQEFDLVFLDPPYDSGLYLPCVQKLGQRGWLAGGALVYLESAARAPALALPASWGLWREKCSGDVRYRLLRCP